MSDIHVTRELLRAVFRGELPPRALTQVGWAHLMSLCPCCREEFSAWQREQAAAESGSYDAAFRILPLLIERQSQDLEEKQETARKDLRELLKLPQEARLARIRRALHRFRGLTLARMLLDEARKNIPAKPLAAQELAETANAVLLRTAETPGINDLLARAAALQGNALRARGQLPEAEKLIAGARSIIRQRGVTDPFIYAEVDWFEGALRKDQRRFHEAEDLLTRAAALFHLAGESTEAARALLSLGLMYHDQQELRKATEATRAALWNLSAETEPQLYLCGRHNLAVFLCETGQPLASAEALAADADLYQRFSDAWTRLRKVWLEGKIAYGLGKMEEAERSFLETRKGFIAEGNGYDVAMVSLDLALVYAKQGKTAELRQLADEMHTIFSAEDVHREALAALAFFEEAVRQDRATVEVLEDLAAYLKRARSNPTLRFRQG